MIKQLLAVTAIVGMMAGTALAQTGGGTGGTGGGAGSGTDSGSGATSNSGSGSQNTPPTAGGIAPTGKDTAPMYRDSQGNPCSAGSAGCSRVEGTMKK